MTKKRPSKKEREAYENLMEEFFPGYAEKDKKHKEFSRKVNKVKRLGNQIRHDLTCQCCAERYHEYVLLQKELFAEINEHT